MRTGLRGHRIKRVYPTNNDVGKEHSLEVQDVIDKVNTSYNIDKVNKIWGKNHEERRKEIFWGNVLRIPVRVFLGFSIMYFSPFIVNLPAIIKSPEKVDSVLWALIRTFFNSPYYIFDLRIGIIASIASLLLSLFVSVGKFADGAGGINGEARRAAYRQFARVVGYIVFCVFVIVFWHGLLAGYFQGTSYAPEFFGDWANGPGWGKQVVPPDVKLERYADIPLWTLIFFAWFTLSSSLMLTYNENDILIKYASILQRVKNVSKVQGSSVELAYRIIDQECVGSKRELNFVNQGISVGELHVSRSNGEAAYEFNRIVSRNRGYTGFDIKDAFWIYFSGVEWVKIIVPWLASLLFAQTMPRESGFIFIFFVTLLVVLCVYAGLSSGTYLFKEIYDFNVLNIKKGRQKIFEFFRFYFLRIFEGVMVWMLVSLISIYVIEAFVVEIAKLIEGQEIFWEAHSGLAIFVFFVISLIIACLIIYYVNKTIRKSLALAIEGFISDNYSNEMKMLLKGGEEISPEGSIDYILVTYIYCLVKNSGEIYSEYKYESESID